MKSSYATLIQSKYFNPAFNSAIFDGPVRIYFAQFHEALALKIYFLIQQKLTAEIAKAKEISKASGSNILIMIYPTEDSFLFSFENENSLDAALAVDSWDDDVVIGLRGPIEDNQLDHLMGTLTQCIDSWKPANQTHYPLRPEL
jgi:hypothetical protein